MTFLMFDFFGQKPVETYETMNCELRYNSEIKTYVYRL